MSLRMRTRFNFYLKEGTIRYNGTIHYGYFLGCFCGNRLDLRIRNLLSSKWQQSRRRAKLLNLSGADRTKINFLLEEYLAEFANISDNSDESDGGDLDNDSPSSDESSDESSENDLDQNMDDIGDFGNAMTRLTARGDIVSQDSNI